MITVFEVLAQPTGSRYLYATREIATQAARNLIKMQGITDTEIQIDAIDGLPDTVFLCAVVRGRRTHITATVRSRRVWEEP